MKKISAKIICDSKNQFGDRLTTFVLTFPRMILAEFNTHRALSKNSASSRAIPFKKMLNMVLTDPFIPIRWMKDHSGMQGNEYFTSKTQLFLLKQLWLTGRNFAVIIAWVLNKMGLTKQIVNRILEPFMWHTVITTGTEWENFFALRAHPAAEIHIDELAQRMLEKYNESIPKQLEPGEWHIPFGDKMDNERLMGLILETDMSLDQIMLKIASARCARVSYNNFNGKDDYNADIKLHDRLSKQGHMSPMEHCGRAMTLNEHFISQWSGNLQGFIQYRKLFDDENKNDPRVLSNNGIY